MPVYMKIAFRRQAVRLKAIRLLVKNKKIKAGALGVKKKL